MIPRDHDELVRDLVDSQRQSFVLRAALGRLVDLILSGEWVDADGGPLRSALPFVKACATLNREVVTDPEQTPEVA